MPRGLRFCAVILLISLQTNAVRAEDPAEDCESPLQGSDEHSKFGTYYPMSGSQARDYAQIFVGEGSWVQTRQRALMEEFFLHELKVDLVLDSLAFRLHSSAATLKSSINLSTVDEGILFQSGDKRLKVRFFRRVFTAEPVRIDFEYQRGSSPAESAQFYFPESYRRAQPGQPEGGRVFRRRRLTWGLADRFKGTWSPELFEFFVEGILASDVLSPDTRATAIIHQKFPRKAAEAAREYFDNYYRSSARP